MKIKYTISILLLLAISFFFISQFSFAEEKSSSPNRPTISKVSSYQKFMQKISRFQGKLNRKITLLIKKIKDEKSIKAILSVIGLAFFYGIIHALGPGHGKIFSASFFLSDESKIKYSFLLGNLIAFFHVLSAVCVVLITSFILKKSSYFLSANIDKTIRLVSYSLILLIGLILLLKNIYDTVKSKNEKEIKVYHEINMKSIVLLALMIGIVPCPGALLILIFSMAKKVLLLGVVLVVFMALGQGLTISMIGTVTLLAKKYGVMSFVNQNSKKGFYFHQAFAIIGSFLITLFGLLFLLGSF